VWGGPKPKANQNDSPLPASALDRAQNTVRINDNQHGYFYNTGKPHQGIQQNLPVTPADLVGDGPLYRREILGGIIKRQTTKSRLIPENASPTKLF
jgi:hypothetical protein